MDESTRTLLEAAVRGQVAAHGRVRPPWQVYPGEGPYSICWRMGGGEWHIMVWGHWWHAACPDEATQIAYFAADQPPTDWLDWAATTIWPGTDEDEAVRRLTTHGIGDYAIWRAWLDALKASTGRPVLFLDVDGTLIPFGDAGSGASALDPELGRRLAELPCDLVWATTWMAAANEEIGPRLGLPALPVFDWSDGEDEAPGRVHWKTRGLLGWASGRPFVWVDDEITDADREWVAAATGTLALLHRVDPRHGLTGADLDVIERWLAERQDRD